MPKDETYYFHQTPETLAIELINMLDLEEGDIVLEPFKGEGSFYNNFPENVVKHYTEIEEGLDYKDFKETVDWVCTNPPFQIETDTKRVNSFYPLLEYYSDKVNKGIAFLANDRCFSTLTPKRIKILEANNLFLSKVIVCNIRKWRGRYFFIIFKKDEPSQFFDYLDNCF
jgi:tRNA G10  N-methylase Trm11